jgi:hypothetical protein
MKIFISYSNQLLELETKENQTIQELKKEIEKKIDIKKEYQILKKNTGDFIYENTIKDNEIKEEETIQLINLENDDFFEKKELKELLCGNILF